MPFNHIGKWFSRCNVSSCQSTKIDQAASGIQVNVGIGLLLMISVWCQAASAEVLSPKVWLEKMSVAMQELNYQGTFVYRRDEDLAAMKVTHIADEQGARELIETLTGELRKELRNSPHSGKSSDGAGASSDVSQLKLVDNYYTLKLLGSDRAAGRDTQLISVSPKDEYRYGYRLWLDNDTGLLLKSDLLDQQGRVLEQVMFTSLELIESEKTSEPLSSEQSDQSMRAHSENKSSPSRLMVGHLPKGFELIESQTGVGHSDVEHMVYSDGLASVSVFVEKSKPEGETFVGLSRMGAVNAFGSVQNGYQITVVGDVPEITVKTIGQSISLKGAHK